MNHPISPLGSQPQPGAEWLLIEDSEAQNLSPKHVDEGDHEQHLFDIYYVPGIVMSTLQQPGVGVALIFPVAQLRR
jgi:hypothetical protein